MARYTPKLPPSLSSLGSDMFEELLMEPEMKSIRRFYGREYKPGDRVSGLELLEKSNKK